MQLLGLPQLRRWRRAAKSWQGRPRSLPACPSACGRQCAVLTSCPFSDRGDLFSSPLSQASGSERDVPGLLARRPKSLPRCGAVPEPSRPGGRSPCSQQDGPRPTEVAGGEVREEEPPGTPRGTGGPASPRRPEGGETPGVETSRTSPGRRAVSQQTSFDASPGLPSRVRALDGGGLGCEGTSGYAPTELPCALFQLRQRAVSQQTSFETLEPQFPTAQVSDTDPSNWVVLGAGLRAGAHLFDRGVRLMWADRASQRPPPGPPTGRRSASTYAPSARSVPQSRASSRTCTTKTARRWIARSQR